MGITMTQPVNVWDGDGFAPHVWGDSSCSVFSRTYYI